MREILLERDEGGKRMTSGSLEAMHISAEEYLVGIFEDSVVATFHRSRVTLAVKDMHLIRYMRSRYDPGQW